MASLKILLALAMFGSGVYRVYLILEEKQVFEPVQMRSKQGFLLDNAPALVVSASEIEKYKQKLNKKSLSTATPREALAGAPLPEPKLSSDQAPNSELPREPETQEPPSSHAASVADVPPVDPGAGVESDDPNLKARSDDKLEPNLEAKGDEEPEPSPEAGSAESGPRDEPKRNKEGRVVYKVNCDARNSEGLMPQVVWDRLVEKSGKTQVVVAEDSDLQKVSKDHFGGERCWPKLWSLNPSIENPHRVVAGTTVFFKAKETKKLDSPEEIPSANDRKMEPSE